LHHCAIHAPLTWEKFCMAVAPSPGVRGRGAAGLAAAPADACRNAAGLYFMLENFPPRV
jgi:hypothetical protein